MTHPTQQTKRVQRPHRKWPYFAILFGGVFILLGMFAGSDQSDFFENSIEVTLTVVEVEERFHDDGEVIFRPVFETVNSNGETIRYRSHLSSRPSLHETGDVVLGRYSPKTGELMSYESMEATTGIGLIFIVIGSVIVVGGLYFSGRHLLNAKRSGQ